MKTHGKEIKTMQVKQLCKCCFLLLLVACFLLLASCGGGKSPAQESTAETPLQQNTEKEPSGSKPMQTTEPTPQTTEPATQSGEPVTDPSAITTVPDPEPPVPTKSASLTVNGTPISEYKLVCAAGPWRSYVQTDSAAFEGQDTEFDHLSAEKLAAYLKQRFSIELPIIYDSDETRQSPELIVGASKRVSAATAGVNSLKNGAYFAKTISNNDYIVAGDSYGVTWHAVDALTEELDRRLAASTETETVIDLAEISLSGSHRLTVVGCVGDSITEGVGTPDGRVYSYPSVLQRVLWRDYTVINYGNSGKTMRTDLYTANGYREGWYYTQQHTDCVANLENLDIILLMLGTNDSNRVAYTTSYKKWGIYDTVKFVQEGKDRVNEFLAKNPDLTIYLMNCPAYYGTEAFGDENVRAAQAALYAELLSEKAPVKWVDMFSFTSEQLGVTYFNDRLHPNQYGAAKMAKEMGRILEEDAGAEPAQPVDTPNPPISFESEGKGEAVEVTAVFEKQS